MTSPPKPRLSDSPWFWVYLFGTFALVALVLIGPRYAQRQARLERQFQARERSGLVVPRENADEPLSTPDDTIISLVPLYVLTGVLVIGGWVLLWWTHWRKRQTPTDHAVSNPDSGATPSNVRLSDDANAE